MSLLGDEEISEIARQRESFRLTNVSSKLTRSEAERLDDLAKKHGLQRGELSGSSFLTSWRATLAIRP